MADVNILIDVATKAAIRELSKLEKGFDDLESEAKKAGNESEKSFALMSKGAAGAAVAVAAIGAAAVKAISAASKFQDLETQFIAFTGSAESAAQQVERIAEFSGQTPFQVEDLANANRTLLAFGSSTEQSFKQLKQLGEAAAATGNNVTELAQIFGQIQVAGKLTGERFNQLAERGINLGPALAKGLGVAENELEKLRSTGQISSNDVAKAFASMTEGSGQFAGSMDRLSKTFKGATSTLSDNIDLIAADLGKLLLPIVTDVVVGMTDVVKAIRELTGASKEKITLTSEMESLGKEIEKTEKAIELFQNRASKLDLSDDADLEFYNKLQGNISRANDKLEEQIATLSRLQQARKAEVSKGRESEEIEAEAKRLSELEAQKEAQAQASAARIRETSEKLNAELAVLSEQRAAIELVAEENKNVALEEQYSARLQLILQKESEKNIALLELQGQYEVAAQEQADEALRQKEESERQALERRKAVAEKARKEEFNAEKQIEIAKANFEAQTWQQRAATTKSGLDALANLRNSGFKEAFEVGKAAAIAQALIDTPAAAQKAFTSLAGIPVVGPALGTAAAAAAIAAGIGRVNQIRSQTFTAFAEGGVVPGTGNKDTVPSMLTPGEVVVPEKNFESLKFNNEAQVQVLNSVETGIQETNGLLRLIAGNQVIGNQEFLEEKFKSSTPGGIFYEPVDDSYSERNRREGENIRAWLQQGNGTSNRGSGGTSQRIRRN